MSTTLRAYKTAQRQSPPLVEEMRTLIRTLPGIHPQAAEHVLRRRLCGVTIQHWLPTQERRNVEQYLQVHGDFPANLCVRVSSPILGGRVPTFPRHPMLTVSIVTTAYRTDAHNCPSRHQGNKCGTCRACWNRGVKAVPYHKH